MRVLDLFSGIGGFSLAAHSLGMDTLAFCECEPYPVRVLNRHWPDVPVFPDVKELTADALADTECVGRQLLPLQRPAEVIAGVPYSGELGQQSRSLRTDTPRPDRRDSETDRHGLILTAGFPCQDISYAGKGAGLAGERSGLFYEVARLIGELRPDYVLLENVAALLTRGLDAVLGTLASLGHDTLWACVPACAVGAPHRRDRVWLLAIPESPDSKQRLEAMYAHVLSRLTPFGDLRDGWPTATASDAWSGDLDRAGMVGKHNLGLGTAARWPTPDCQNVRDGRSVRVANNIEAGGSHAVSLNHRIEHGTDKSAGSLNPAWVETLMGYPIGYTLPEGEPLVTLPGVWPSDSPDGRGWMTPKSGDGVFASGSTSGRSREMSTHLPTQVKLTQTWPAGLGTPQHEWEPPRLTTEKQHRASRLKALGNSIVPAIARLWLAAIQEEVA